MSNLVTQAQIAREAGIARTSVSQAVKEGRLPSVETKRGKRINLDDPAVRAFIEKASIKSKIQRDRAEDLAEELDDGMISQSEANRLKAIADAALKQVKKEREALEYAEKLNAVIDAETLRRKMGVFADFLTTHLVYLPEDISSSLWMEAKASDDPEATIREVLGARIAKVIAEAKRVAAEIEPPPAGRRYLIVDHDEQE